MATRISDALNVSHAKLTAQGVFDAFTDIDSHFHIHPALFAATSTPELASSDDKIKKHFTNVIHLLDASKVENDVFYKRAINFLTFPEIPLAALGYCEANDVDLSREPNAGRGPVDFKASKGYKSRVSVEVKYTTNKQLAHGYEKQLPIYDKAEQTFHSIYLVIQTNNLMGAIRKIQKLRSEALIAENRAPDIIIIDGRQYPSASHS